ncbi:MAG: PAS domain S-box protein, partial [Planctomycetota bacterium]
KGSRIGEDTGKRKDGSLFDVQVSASVIKDDAGNPMCMFGSFLDITERKKAEKDLLVKDWALESAITGIGITTLDGEVIYVNDAAVKMWGYDNKEDMLGRSLPEFWGGDVVDKTIEELHEKGLRIGEDVGKKKDGSLFDVLVSASVIKDQAGNPMYMFGSFLDITDRKKAEMELRVKDSALASAIIGVGITTVDGRLIYVNDALVKMWGYDNKEEILGRNLPEFWEGDGIFETIKALREKGSRIAEDIGKRKDGSLFDVEFSATMIKDHDGHPMYMFGSFLDISERKKAEELVREMALLPKLNPSPVLRFDSEGVIKLSNEAAVRILGDAVSKKARLKDVLPDLAHINLKRCIEQGLVLIEEVRVKDRYFQFMIRGVPDLGLAQAYGSDITERKKAENALRKAHGELEGRVFQRTMELAGTNQELKSEIAERRAAEKALAQELQISRHRQEEVSALLEGSRVVLEHHTFEDAAKKLFRSCKKLTGAMSGYVALLSDDESGNDVLYLDPGEMTCSVDPSLPMPIRGLREVVYRTGEPAYENSFARSEWMKFMPAGHVNLDNVLFAPMKIKGLTVGLLGLGNKPGGFDETDAKMAGAFAELAAVALKNSRTLGALRRSQEELSQARDHLEELVQDRTAELQKTNEDLEKQIARRRKAGQELEDKQKQLKTLTSELALAEERERRRIAVGIHDNIGQKMALAKLELQSSMTSARDAKMTGSLESVCDRIDEAIKESHSLTFELSNPALYELSFDAAIEQWLLEQIQKKQNIECEVTANTEPVELSVNLKVMLFQAIRELAVNVVKYASASSLSVKINKGKNRIAIEVKDDGIGFLPSKKGTSTSDDKGGFGLFNIRERIEHLGGAMKIKSAPKKGTTIRLTVPFDKQ